MSLQNSVFSLLYIVTVCCGQIPYQLCLKTPKLGNFCEYACILSVEASSTGGRAVFNACCGVSIAIQPAPHLHETPLKCNRSLVTWSTYRQLHLGVIWRQIFNHPFRYLQGYDSPTVFVCHFCIITTSRVF